MNRGSNDWVAEVIQDLVTFTSKNGLYDTASVLLEAKLTFALEGGLISERQEQRIKQKLLLLILST